MVQIKEDLVPKACEKRLLEQEKEYREKGYGTLISNGQLFIMPKETGDNSYEITISGGEDMSIEHMSADKKGVIKATIEEATELVKMYQAMGCTAYHQETEDGEISSVHLVRTAQCGSVTMYYDIDVILKIVRKEDL